MCIRDSIGGVQKGLIEQRKVHEINLKSASQLRQLSLSFSFQDHADRSYSGWPRVGGSGSEPSDSSHPDLFVSWFASNRSGTAGGGEAPGGPLRPISLECESEAFAKNHAILTRNLAHRQHRVMPAEAERIAQRDLNVRPARHIRTVVQITVLPWILQIHRRRDNPVA